MAHAAGISGPETWNERGIRSYKEGDYRTAIRCFRAAAESLPEDEVVRSNLASSHAQLALQIIQGRMVGSGYTEAVRAAERALEIEGDHAYFHKVLGFVFQENGDYEKALTAFSMASSLEPEDGSTWALMGDAAYHFDNLGEAINCWRRALQLDPSQDKVRERLGKAGREEELEEGYREAHSPHFQIRYDADYPDGRNLARSMLEIMEDARRKVLDELGFTSTSRTSGVFYSPDDFRNLMGNHEWTRGIYDGKIRIPFPADGVPGRAFREVVTHEYTHVALFEWTGNHCPAWLNEGLAQNLAGEWNAARERSARTLAANSSFLPLTALQNSFMDLPGPMIEIAYIESYLVVSYIRDEYTHRHLRNLLDAIAEGDPADEAVRTIFRCDSDELLERALSSYQSKIAIR